MNSTDIAQATYAQATYAQATYAEAYLLEALYSAPSNVDALKWALEQDMDRLKDMAYLCGTSEGGDRPTLAFRVVVVGRWLDEDEEDALRAWTVRQTAVKRAAAAACN